MNNEAGKTTTHFATELERTTNSARLNETTAAQPTGEIIEIDEDTDVNEVAESDFDEEPATVPITGPNTKPNASG